MNKKSVEPRRTKRLREVVETKSPKTEQVSVIFTTFKRSVPDYLEQNDYNQRKKMRKVISKEKSICSTGKDRKKHLIAFNFQLPIHGYINKIFFFILSFEKGKRERTAEQVNESDKCKAIRSTIHINNL